MLERLQVEGLGIIDQVDVDLGPGFIALTGETGAGKSLLVESLKLLTGQRASSDLVRSGDDRLRVTGWFRCDADDGIGEVLDELGIASDDLLVVRREVSEAGRSRCWVNDTPVTTGALQRLAPSLVAIHGQHDQHGLAEPASQRDLVDASAGNTEHLEAVATAYRAWREADAELRRLQTAAAARRDRLDAIAYQIAEIDEVAPVPNEDEELRSRRRMLRHAVRLGELREGSLQRLADGEGDVLTSLTRAERNAAEMVELGVPLPDLAQRLAEARVVVEDVIRELQQLESELDGDPAELEALESRLHRLEQLMLKYGEPLSAVLDHRARLTAENEELAGVGEKVEAAAAARLAALRDYDRAAQALTQSRQDAAAELLEHVATVLEGLAMAGTRLEMRWQARRDPSSPLERAGEPVAFDETGVEECDLLIAANPGEEPRPMRKIASGGELSRLHLALRTALRQRSVSGSLTLLFDEVDSGLGGGAAAALADTLVGLAASDQVIVVTHLPQVAARGGRHLKVEKVLDDGRAVTRIAALDRAARELELARMLSGEELPESARTHARALLDR